MAYLKTEQFKKCIADADKAIKLEPNYVKAYFRRGKAHFARKNWQQAVEDFETVLDKSLGELVDNLDIRECLKQAREKLDSEGSSSSGRKKRSFHSSTSSSSSSEKEPLNLDEIDEATSQTAIDPNATHSIEKETIPITKQLKPEPPLK